MTGWTEWLVIGAVVLLVWNARKIPLLASSLGESIKSFKKGLKEEKRKTRDVTELEKEPARKE